MLILRLLFILSALSIGVSAALYLLTQDPRYLGLARQIARFVMYALLIGVLVFAVERYALVAWRVII